MCALCRTHSSVATPSRLCAALREFCSRCRIQKSQVRMPRSTAGPETGASQVNWTVFAERRVAVMDWGGRRSRAAHRCSLFNEVLTRERLAVEPCSEAAQCWSMSRYHVVVRSCHIATARETGIEAINEHVGVNEGGHACRDPDVSTHGPRVLSRSQVDSLTGWPLGGAVASSPGQIISGVRVRPSA